MKKLLLTGLLIITITVIKAQSTVGLNSSYTFNDGTYNDQTGDNHGQNSNTILVADRFGNANKAAYFNGNSYIHVGDSSELDLNNLNVLSISFWSKQTSFNSNIKAVISKWTTNATSEQYGIFAVNFDFSVAIGTILTSAATIPVSNDTNWNHFVLIYHKANGTITGYKNGSLGGTVTPGTFPGSSSTSSFVIGAQRYHAGNYGRHFTGNIDDIYVYDRVLTPTDISDLYNAANPVTGIDESQNSTHLSVYPNPTKNTLTINTNEQIQAITIIDVTSKTVQTLTNPSNIINVSELTNGLYFLTVTTKNGVNYSRFIKE
jgi:hypothetical protein